MQAEGRRGRGARAVRGIPNGRFACIACARRVGLGLLALDDGSRSQPSTATAGAGDVKAREYVVVYEQGASAAEGREAVEAAGGTVVDENAAIGVATVRSNARDFAAQRRRQDGLEGAAPNEAIGQAPREQQARRQEIEKVTGGAGAGARRPASKAKAGKAEPLAGLQWDMAMIGATADGSYTRAAGLARRCASA